MPKAKSPAINWERVWREFHVWWDAQNGVAGREVFQAQIQRLVEQELGREDDEG